MSDVAQRTVTIFEKLLNEKSNAREASASKPLLTVDLSELKFDSLEKMELIMELEDTFKISLDEDEVIACDKVSDLVVLIERSL